MSQTHKSPYEIRLNLLELSFGILCEQHQAKAALNKEVAPTTSPTTDDVIAEAQKLNNFVSASTSRLER